MTRVFYDSGRKYSAIFLYFPVTTHSFEGLTEELVSIIMHIPVALIRMNSGEQEIRRFYRKQ